MSIFPTKKFRLILTFIVLFLHLSCSKDTDFLSEVLLSDSQKALLDIKVIAVKNVAVVIDITSEGLNGQVTDVSEPNNGTANVNPDNTITYTPDTDVEGTDEFEYTVTNPSSPNPIGTGTVSITIAGQDKVLPTGEEINFSKYGAVGDGVTDDTEALQRAFNAESNLVANPNSTFKISKTLEINLKYLQFIEWNNATIIVSKALNPAMRIDKRKSNGGTTVMNNLLIDGNELGIRGIEIRSRVIFNDIDVKDLNQGSQSISPAGFVHKVDNDNDSVGGYILNDCDITNLVGNSDCVVASNTDGSVNGYLFYWDAVPTIKTTITINNMVIDGTWGDDGGGIFINDHVNIGTSASGHIFNSVIVKNFERRALKGFSSNMEFNNCTFQDPDPKDSRIHCATISGLAVFGGNNKKNVHFNNCDFISRGYDGRVIPIGISNFSIKNSRFLGGADINFQQSINGGLIENCQFSQGSILYKTNNPSFPQKLVIDSKNIAEPNYIKLNSNDYILK